MREWRKSTVSLSVNFQIPGNRSSKNGESTKLGRNLVNTLALKVEQSSAFPFLDVQSQIPTDHWCQFVLLPVVPADSLISIDQSDCSIIWLV